MGLSGRNVDLSRSWGVVYEVKGRELCVMDRDERRTPVAAAGRKLGEELLSLRQTFEVDN